ncbi:hypothetical protein SLS64_014077 [Diaporthe eres]|uniref:Major facilitator superfamily (MFS) profile domain-containing protein n=1 Tax=Diaporthe eres TaxID=83184 RepID=A0ABR1NLX5_DIAER
MEQDELLTATEDSALLSVPSPGTDRGSWPLYRDRISAFRQHVQQWRTFYSCLLLLFLVDAPIFMSEGPRIRMLEMGLCREYYEARDPGVIGPGGTVPEHLCKLRDIQSPLARLRGFLGLLEGLPGLLFAVPYGILADARGRRLVAGACVLGFILRDTWTFVVLYFHETFPLRALYAAPTFVLLGGGTTLFGPMIMAIVAATVPEVFRTQAFFYVHVVILVSEMVAPAIGVLLLDAIGPHLTFLVGIPVKALGFIALFFIKEKAKEPDDGNHDSAGEEAEPATQGKIRRPLTNLMRYILHVFQIRVATQQVMIINVFGAGYASAMRSFLTSLVSRRSIALLYTTMALFEGTAVLGAAPLLGLTFSAGVELGGFAVGLPFFVSAGVYGLGAIGVWCVNFKQREVD